ncbi:MAG: hypothetical protein ACYCZO_14710 [Daejeonella sp.]
MAKQAEEIKEQITYTRKKQSAHKGRAALPAHLPAKYALQNIMTINHKNVRDLYPQNFKKLIRDNKM